MASVSFVWRNSSPLPSPVPQWFLGISEEHSRFPLIFPEVAYYLGELSAFGQPIPTPLQCLQEETSYRLYDFPGLGCQRLYSFHLVLLKC